MFDQLPAPEPDALHGVMERYAQDPRPDKMDLGVGVYRAADGASPIMRAVSEANQTLLELEKTKAYGALRGVDAFLAGMSGLLPGVKDFERIAAVQTVGGTGGIRLALELSRAGNKEVCVHIGVPTWPNHIGICDALELRTNYFEYFDQASQTLNINALEAIVENAAPGDVVIFHGPCHNPTGADLPETIYADLIRRADKRGLIPLIDAAYYGLGNRLGDDLDRLSTIVNSLSRGFLIMSCSKAFGLYRERTGILFTMTQSSQQRAIVQAALETLGRRMYSLPPSYGATLVGYILNSDELTNTWQIELDEMRERVKQVRAELTTRGRAVRALSSIPEQKGIFSLLPIQKTDTERLATDHGIHMPASGRINVAGFKTGDVERFCEALQAVLTASNVPA